MLHKRIFPGLLLAGLMLIIAGCSGDDTPTPTSTTVQGDLDNPEFVVLQEHINTYLDESTELFLEGMSNIYQLPADTEQVRVDAGATGPNDTVIAVYLGGWHVTYVSQYNVAFNAWFRDSVQFRANSEVIEEATGLDYLHFIKYWGYSSNYTEETHTDKTGHLDLVFENLDTDLGIVNGTNDVIMEWNYLSNDTSITAIFDIEAAVTDLTMSRVPSHGWINGCPLSGTYTMEVAESYSIAIGNYSDFWIDSWTVSITITNGIASVTVNRDNVVWNYDHTVCSPSTS
jgi:hypothetical protein